MNRKSKDEPPPAGKDNSARPSVSVPADFTSTESQPSHPANEAVLEQIHPVQDLDVVSPHTENEPNWEYQPPPSMKAPAVSGGLSSKPGSVIFHPQLPTRQSEITHDHMTRARKPSETVSYANTPITTPKASHHIDMEELELIIKQGDLRGMESSQSILQSFPPPECSGVPQQVQPVVQCKDLDPQAYVHHPNDPALITFKPPKDCEEVRRTDRNCTKDIMLGEMEKENVRAVGRELLTMGRRILDEINFAETFRGVHGSGGARRDNCGPVPRELENIKAVKSTGNARGAFVAFDEDNLPHKDEEREARHPVETRPASHDENVQTERVVETAYANWAEEIQKSKLAFIAAFDHLCCSLGKMGLEQGHTDVQCGGGPPAQSIPGQSSHTEDEASYLKTDSKRQVNPSASLIKAASLRQVETLDGGGGGERKFSRESTSRNLPPNSADNPTIFPRVCTSTGTCIDGMEVISELNQLTMDLNMDVMKLQAKFQELDDQVGVILSSIVKHNEASSGKMERLEGDLVKLMRLVYEMQCAQKLQMHFGRPTQGDSTET